ncbi:MAG: alanine racemase [Candidatus Eremiobacteraeota bacterium]|nr:alanine racemase [Candidatus Eremiobacteraeota bacterium]
MYGKITISLEALRNNAQHLRAFIAPARVAFAIKSNAYGHGLQEVALAIEQSACLLCVFSLEEAVTLRDGGITKPILVLGPIAPEYLETALMAKVSIALWDTGVYALRVASIARRRNTTFPVHIKINTGLNRLGLSARDAADAIEDYLRMAELRIEGVFSHLAAAEEMDSPYTLSQLASFEAALAPVQEQLQQQEPRPVLHIAASAAAMLWPQTRLDMVRVGIALYGLWPSPATRRAVETTGLALEPVLRYETTLTATRHVASGEAVGYGTTFHAPQSMRIGIVPLGYADGIPRLLSNTGAFAVRGARCPIIGRICMNMTMIDLTAAPQATDGDRVTLIGKDGNTIISADDWAQWAQTINYEIVTRLPSEIPREYLP